MKKEDNPRGGALKMLVFWACLIGFMAYLIIRTGIILNYGITKREIAYIIITIAGWVGLCILSWKNAHGTIK